MMANLCYPLDMAEASLTPELIKEIRTRLGLTQAEAAARCGVTLSTWGRWECGLRNPSGPARVIILAMQADANSKTAVV
jgi:putative transcriptional regulator